MIRLDHFVIHVDADLEHLRRLQREIAPLGYPFEPTWGKGTRGFKAANIFVGWQYLEIVWLLRADGGGWFPAWVEQYNRGHRGVTAVMLLTDRLDALREELLARGLRPGAPERTSFRFFFGLLKKTLPWRYVLLDPIPGTDLQIGFIEVDGPKVLQAMRSYMVPNADEHGITGIRAAVVRHDFSPAAWVFLRTVFPEAVDDGGRLTCRLDENTSLAFERAEGAPLQLELQAVTTRPERAGGSFELENVRIRTVPAGR